MAVKLESVLAEGKKEGIEINIEAPGKVKESINLEVPDSAFKKAGVTLTTDVPKNPKEK